MNKLTSLANLVERFCFLNGMLYPTVEEHPCGICTENRFGNTRICDCTREDHNHPQAKENPEAEMNYRCFVDRGEWKDNE